MDDAEPEPQPEQGTLEAELPRGMSAPEPEPEPSLPAASKDKEKTKVREVQAAPVARSARASSPASPSRSPSPESRRASASPAVSSPSRTSAQATSKTTAPKPRVEPRPATPRVSPQPTAEAAQTGQVAQDDKAITRAAPAPAKPKVTVTVPRTDHVHVEVPTGLQHWLDEDDRMRPWLSKAVNVADSCYANERTDDPSVSGAISLVVTMHENARPSGKVGSVSPGLSGIVMCATTRMLGVKMPLFTGSEGETYTVRVRFDP